MIHYFSVISLLTAWMSAAAFAAGAVFDVRDYGARADGTTLCTAPIQKAMDACAAAGGGTVTLAGGQFLSGTIHLRSHVTLRIEAGATLLGSTNIAHYPHNIPAIRSYTDYYVKQSLIAGENLENVALVGRGLIDGQGKSFKMKDRSRPYENRPYLIRLVNCRDVLVEGLRLQKSAMWMQHYLGCERVTMRGVRVWNFGNANNDGLDLDGCKDCTVSQCVFESDDDGITLKSTFERPCDSITISDCIASRHCNAIKMGTESNGGFKNITIANCVVTSPFHTNVTYGRSRGMSGISLELVDGGQLERVAISNITIHGVNVPLFLRLGDRARPFKEGMEPQPVGSFRDVVINNIVATGVGKIGCSITGLTNAPIENVSLSNLMFEFEGGGARKLAEKEVAELPKKYPECMMFGDLPAYGFYCRHAKGLRFSNIQLRIAAADLRHAMVFDDVENLAVDGLDAAFWPGGAAMLGLAQVRDALIRGCQPRAKDGTFLKLAGDKSRNITLIANDLSGAAKAVEVAPDAPKDALVTK
ncbi:MAG: glycoside hydrolase family 28 protein [Verrucomicrobia bacterium]|nr:glycoside hydrolase family 28 protein [Verrucomicrobiota bacterium]